MAVQRFTVADAKFERSPGQQADVFAANLVDERHGGPITIGYGRYAPDQTLRDQIAVDDVMIVLEGRISVETVDVVHSAGPGEIIYMPKGETVAIHSHGDGALTAYVTYPHWAESSQERITP
jgi:ethanolamine utilization protein EutQ (cupin superfamily)